MKGTDGIPVLLQDIKEMPGGIGCILLGCFLGLAIGWPIGALFAVIGAIILGRAWFAHQVVNTPDSPSEKETSHGL